MGLADLGRIDDVIHGRMRLGIMVYLADADAADFTELKTVLEATQGNLSVHLKKLEEAGYVAIAKSFFRWTERLPWVASSTVFSSVKSATSTSDR